MTIKSFQALLLSRFRRDTQSVCLPPEIWLEVFSSDELSSNDIRNITLTNSQFRWLAQPLLFRTLSVTQLKFRGLRRRVQTPTYFKRFMRRLEFSISDRIISSIRTIVIASRMKFLDYNNEEVVDGFDILYALFNVLPRFPNITTVKGSAFTLTNYRVEQLFKLPNLRSLQLYDILGSGVSAMPTVTPQSKLEELVMELPWWNQGIVSPPVVPWWISLLCPNRTRRVHFLDGPNSIAFFQWVASSVSMMPSLRVLNVAPTAIASSAAIRTFEKCPGIQQLSLPEPWSLHPTPPAQTVATVGQILQIESVRQIKKMSIPPAYAMAFVEQAPFLELSISNVIDGPLFAAVAEQLALHHSTTLTHLDLQLQVLCTASFRRLITEVPSLMSLTLQVSSDLSNDKVLKVCCTFGIMGKSLTPEQICNCLLFPEVAPNLSHLSIQPQGRWMSSTSPPYCLASWHPILYHCLQRRYRNLRYMYICGKDIELIWSGDNKVCEHARLLWPLKKTHPSCLSGSQIRGRERCEQDILGYTCINASLYYDLSPAVAVLNVPLLCTW